MFGPYNVVMVIILVVGVLLEIYIISWIFYGLFNQIQSKLIQWIITCGENTAIFIIKIANGKASAT